MVFILIVFEIDQIREYTEFVDIFFRRVTFINNTYNITLWVNVWAHMFVLVCVQNV